MDAAGVAPGTIEPVTKYAMEKEPAVELEPVLEHEVEPEPGPMAEPKPEPLEEPEPEPEVAAAEAEAEPIAPAKVNLATVPSLDVKAGLSVLKPGIVPGDIVIVTGAEGRTGALVVAELLQQYPGVRVRAIAPTVSELRVSLADTLADFTDEALELVSYDLELPESPFIAAASPTAYRRLFKGASAVIWCASSFGSTAKEPSQFVRFVKQMNKEEDTFLDAEGVAKAASCFAGATALLDSDADAITPKFVLLSSAAVSRPSWDDEQRKKFSISADSRTVSLTPKNILGLKLRGEQALRDAAVPYCVLRPCSVNEQHEEGRYVLSAGDIATGCISRSDLAALAVKLLDEPAAQGKTIEAFTVPGLPKTPLSPALSMLPSDRALGAPEPDLATYSILSQLSLEV